MKRWGIIALGLWCSVALAGGPRFVTGTQFSGQAPGWAMAFYTPTPMYYTDPGSLSASVNHAQADAMVAAAAGVWNVPMAAITLAQGGVLAEHVSAANSYSDGVGVVFPADVQPSNYLAKPIAVVYDTDGSLIDLLLGVGASDPEGCRQNGVVESVDGFGQTGTIQHAVILLNGRCVGSAPEQMLQMQYQVERAFGRVLGLAWSQCNDNVFMGWRPVTAGEATNWPVMHPIDVVCGPYTYQCMQEPFTLRPDDLSALAFLYPVTEANQSEGKVLSLTNAIAVKSVFEFATGQGMEGVNFGVYWGLATLPFETYQIVSGVTGSMYQADGGNPVTGAATVNVGSGSGYAEALFLMGRVPLDYSSGRVNQLLMESEAINPLYTGEHAIAPYVGVPVAMSGGMAHVYEYLASGGFELGDTVVANDGAASCNAGSDGVETAPVAVAASGWWTGLMCGPGHAAWVSASVKTGRSWTIEVTALDETGAASAMKMQPVMGVWNTGDKTGTLPTVAAAGAAMNSEVAGMTQLSVAAAETDATVRMVIADQRGRGRPDFSYNARILYADRVAPAVVSAAGGMITITGMGFREGNRVTVNGVNAVVTSWSATQIVATAPSMKAAGMTAGALADVAVMDTGTAGETVMSGVLQYAAPVESVTMLTGAMYVAAGEPVGWSVSLMASDGGPVAGVGVAWSATGGLGLGAPSTVTDATGMAAVSVTSAGMVAGSTGVVTGCAWTTVCASATAYGVDASQWRLAVVSGGEQTVSMGSTLGRVVLVVTDGAGHAVLGAPVVVYQTVDAWEAACPEHGRCPVAPVLATGQSEAVSDANGQVVVTPLQVAGVAEVVKMAAATGTVGFVEAEEMIAP